MKSVIIGSKEIPIEWSQGVARRFRFRMSKHKIKFNSGDFTDDTRAQSAFLEFLYLLLPPAIYSKYETAEDFATSEDWTESQAVSIGECVVDVWREMNVDAEKKSNSENMPLQESKSE